MELLTKEIFHESIRRAGSICILGHVGPDGDCYGSTLAVNRYIRNLRASDGVTIQNYLDEVSPKFLFLDGCASVSTDANDGRVYDLAIICDCADIKRMGHFEKYFRSAGSSLMLDHHFTNDGFGDYGIVNGTASSTSEVLFDLMDEQYFDRPAAECIYTGIIHDTGVFRYSNTSPHTLEIAGKCIEKGISFGSIIEESFFSMSFEQKKVLGYILAHIKMRAGGKIVYSCLSMEERKALDAVEMDMDGMIDHIRTTTGALAAAYMYETKDGRVKVSLRSNSDLADVSRICAKNGGGGHKKAAGCFMSPDFEKNMDEIEADLTEQINNAAAL